MRRRAPAEGAGGRRGSRSRPGGANYPLALPTVPSAADTGSARILLVDDEQSVQTLLTLPAAQGGLRGRGRARRAGGARSFREQRFDLVVLDIMLPKLDGIEVCRRMRSRSQVPIIMLTAKDDEIDKVLGLEMGADDYITKPFSVREFRSRVRGGAAPRGDARAAARAARSRSWPATCGSTSSGAASSVRGEPARLTYVEFEILAALARSPGPRVQTREMLLEQVWGDCRLPRSAHDRRPHPPPAREARARPEAPEYLFTVRGRRLPLPRPMNWRRAALRNRLAARCSS